jgi:hypothetical protein
MRRGRCRYDAAHLSIATGIGLGFITMRSPRSSPASSPRPAVLALAALFAIKFAVAG